MKLLTSITLLLCISCTAHIRAQRDIQEEVANLTKLNQTVSNAQLYLLQNNNKNISCIIVQSTIYGSVSISCVIAKF